jgi:hypothetical protein
MWPKEQTVESDKVFLFIHDTTSTICGLVKKYLTFGQEKYMYTPGGLQT